MQGLRTILGLLIFMGLLGGGLFWLMQIISLLLTDQEYFDSHTHKLAWFVVIVVGSVIGAVWFYVWKLSRVQARTQSTRERLREALAQSRGAAQDGVASESTDQGAGQ